MGDQAARHRLDGQLRDRRAGVDRRVQGRPLVGALVDAHQDQRARGVRVAVAALQQVGDRRRRCRRRAGRRRTGPAGGRPRSRAQRAASSRRPDLLGVQLGVGVEQPRAPPRGDVRDGSAPGCRRADRSGLRSGWPTPPTLPAGVNEVRQPLILGGISPDHLAERSDSGARRAEVRRILGVRRRADPPRRRAHRRDQEGRATTSSWWSRRWATPPTTCSTWPDRSCPAPPAARDGHAADRG